MKMLNVLELLCESKVDFVKKRYAAKIIASYLNRQMGISYLEDEEIPEKVINGIVRFVDPSMKYLEWVVKQYIAGLYNEEEDDEQVKEDLEEFEKHKRKMQHQDINRYNLNTLRQELTKFTEHVDGGVFHQQIQDAIKKGDVKYIGKQNGIDIYHTLTKEGNILLGRGGGHDNLNKWCTSRPDDKNMFEFYNTRKNSDIYVWFFEDGKRFQCDVSRTSKFVNNWMNELDIDIVKEKVDQDYWEKMRTTKFIRDITEQSMRIEWNYDKYTTTIPEFIKLCAQENRSFFHSINYSNLSFELFKQSFNDILSCITNIKDNIMFLLGVVSFYGIHNAMCRTYIANNTKIIEDAFAKRVYDVVNTDDDKEAVNELIKNNIRLDKLYKSGQNQ